MSLMPSLLWKCFPTSQPNHTALEGWGEREKKKSSCDLSSSHMQSRKVPRHTHLCLQSSSFVPAYLSFFDRVSCSLFKQVDGLVVVQSAATSDHVTQELDAVQLPIGVLGSRVVYKADLRIRSCIQAQRGCSFT